MSAHIPLTPAALRDCLRLPEGTDLDFRHRARDPLALAQVVAAFANTEKGGTILIGIRGRRRRVVGCDPVVLTEVVGKAKLALLPAPTIQCYDVDLSGKKVGVIVVNPCERLVFAGRVAWFREGSSMRRLLKSEIKERLKAGGYGANVDEVRADVSEMHETIGVLREQLASANSFIGKLPDRVGGAVLGAVASAALAWGASILLPWFK